jgi:hypothetical protein
MMPDRAVSAAIASGKSQPQRATHDHDALDFVHKNMVM